MMKDDIKKETAEIDDDTFKKINNLYTAKGMYFGLNSFDVWEQWIHCN